MGSNNLQIWKSIQSCSHFWEAVIIAISLSTRAGLSADILTLEMYHCSLKG